MKRAKPKPIDQENPVWTEQDFAKATPLPGVSLAAAVKRVRRGRGPQVKPKKIAISIRLNPKIIKHFKSGGAGWQSRMEEALLKATGGK